MIFHGQHGIDRVLYERFFRDQRQGFFVEAGAFDGIIDATCLVFERELAWTGVNIEPVPDLFERLQKNRPHSTNLCCALAAKDSTTARFTHAIHPVHGRNFGQGSLLHAPKHWQALVDKQCRFETYEVSCRTYPSLAAEHDWPTPDLFVLDVEGCELDVLSPMLAAPPQLPRVLCIESPFVGLDPLVALLSPYYRHDGDHHHNALFVRVG